MKHNFQYAVHALAVAYTKLMVRDLQIKLD